MRYTNSVLPFAQMASADERAMASLLEEFLGEQDTQPVVEDEPSTSAEGPSTSRPDYINLIDVVRYLFLWGLTSLSLWSEACARADNLLVKQQAARTESLFTVVKAFFETITSRLYEEADLQDNQMGYIDAEERELDFGELSDSVRAIPGSETKLIRRSDLDDLWFLMKVHEDRQQSRTAAKRKLCDVIQEECTTMCDRLSYAQKVNVRENNRQFSAWTKPKKGKYLLRVELYETKDIAGLSFNDRHQKVKTEAEVVVNDGDECAETLDQLVVQMLDSMKKEASYKSSNEPTPPGCP